ncbi:MAG: DUF411 domain-containing protein [Burkholderiaceae bacterium]
MPFDQLRRRICAGAALAPIFGSLFAKTDLPAVDVWKSPSCGCCNDWIKHLEKNGFTVRAHDTGNSVIRSRLGMPTLYASCHTARIAGYAVEGHVPATDVIRLLTVKPDAIGIAVPQMPVGSPGMDGPVYRGRVDPYDVLLIAKDGSASVFQSYR